MIVANEQEARAKVREVLFKYCDPKPQYDGFTAWEISGKILDAIAKDDMRVHEDGVGVLGHQPGKLLEVL